MLARHHDAAHCVAGKMRFAPQHFRHLDLVHIADTVLLGLGNDGRQLRQLFRSPRHHHPAGLQQGQVQPAMDFQVFGIAGTNAGMFQTAARRVETRMQHGAVGLADAREDIGTALDQQTFESAKRKAPEDRTTHHPSADDREVETLGGRCHGATASGPAGEPCRSPP